MMKDGTVELYHLLESAIGMNRCRDLRNLQKEKADLKNRGKLQSQKGSYAKLGPESMRFWYEAESKRAALKLPPI